MQTDFLDKHEKQYLQACHRPPRAWLRAFFWFFVPAIGAASVATQWARGIDQVGALLTGGVILVLMLLYFPVARIAARPFSYRVINWSGVARIKPASKGTGSDEYIGDTRVTLPVGWDARFRAMSGRVVRAHGVQAGESRGTPRVQVLSLDDRYFVSKEVPLGLTKIDLPDFHFGLALIPVFVMIGIALKIRFHLEYLLYFGLVSACFALYGLRVKRNNAVIQQTIAECYVQKKDSDLLSASDRR